VALKEEIAKLESTLKSKKGTLSYSQDQVEEYSKGGYARKVAEMENMRRVRSTMNSSGRSSATAAVCTDFLPVFDKMNELKDKYSDDEFGSKYSGLSMEAAFSKLSVTQFTPDCGDAIDFRVSVVDTECSSSFAKDTVIRSLSSGMELEGNIIRPAECVASLGPEKDEEEDSDEDESSDSGLVKDGDP